MSDLNQTPKVVKTQKIRSESDYLKKPEYDNIWRTQEAVNMAIAEKRVVRFLTTKSNKEIKAEIDNLKGCALRKPDKDSNEVAVIPPWIEDFCFEEAVDTSIKATSNIIIPRPRIYKP